MTLRKFWSYLFVGWPRDGVSALEHSKLRIDLLKHQSTLSAGAIIAVVTFYEKFSSQRFTALIGGALLCFIISIVGGVLAQIGTINLLEDKPNEPSRDIRSITGVSILTSWSAFVAALLFLCLYALVNL